MMSIERGFKVVSQHVDKILTCVQNCVLTHQESIYMLMKSKLGFKTESQHAKKVLTGVQNLVLTHQESI
jgi:hypothetical protein